MNVNPGLMAEWIRAYFLPSSSASSYEAGGEFAELLLLLTSSIGNGTAINPNTYPNPDSVKPFGLQPLAFISPHVNPNRGLAAEHRSTPDQWEQLIQDASQRYGVDPELVRSVIQAESGFNPNAESRAGAKGLMQLMDATARSLGVTDSFDPVQNVNGGTRFLSYLLTKYNGQVGVALAAYNAGPGRVDRLGVRTDAELYASLERLPKETKAYVAKVLDNYRS